MFGVIMPDVLKTPMLSDELNLLRINGISMLVRIDSADTIYRCHQLEGDRDQFITSHRFNAIKKQGWYIRSWAYDGPIASLEPFRPVRGVQRNYYSLQNKVNKYSTTKGRGKVMTWMIVLLTSRYYKARK